MDGQRATLDDDQYGLRFQVQMNKRREKILRIDGYQDGPVMAAVSESQHGQDQRALYINLHRLYRDQIVGEEQQQNHNASAIHARTDSMEDMSTNREDLNNYLTENPLTKALDKFPLKLSAQQRNSVQIMDRLGQGSHAKVFHASYLGTPMALKIYDNLEQASLDAFIGELEAYQDEKRIPLAHPNIVQVLGAYQ